MRQFILDVHAAAPILAQAERVLVIGCSGSGKSTLAARLSAGLGLPHVSMDREVFWMAGWQPRPRADALDRLRRIVDRAHWIIDGTSPGTLPLRLPRADLVIWMRPPRRASLYGILSRWLKFRGRTRPEMADDCPERITWEFLRYVWNFERTESPEIEERLAEVPSVPVLVLRSRRDAGDLIDAITQPAVSSRRQPRTNGRMGAAPRGGR